MNIEHRKKNSDSLGLRHFGSGEVPGLSTKEQLASIIHEISEPVTAAILNATAAQQALAMDPPDLAIARSAIQCLIRDSRDIVEMVAQLNIFFHDVKRDRAPLDIKKLIDCAHNILTANLLESRG